jgi:hypothetical protein
MFLDVIRQPGNLLLSIRRRYGNKDRFVEAAANQFHLAGGHQFPQAIKIFRMIFLNPQQQRAGIVQSQSDFRVLLD